MATRNNDFSEEIFDLSMPRTEEFSTIAGQPAAEFDRGRYIRDEFTRLQRAGGPQPLRIVPPEPELDDRAYKQAMYDWMEQNPQMSDWTPHERAQYAEAVAGKQGDELLSAQLWGEARAGVSAANRATMEDRERVLGALGEYQQDVISREQINQELAREAMQWNAQISSTLNNTMNQLAAMGQSANPYMMSRLQERLGAQAQDALSARRMELEMERTRQKQYYVDTLNQIMQATEHQTLDMGTVMQAMQMLGQGAAGGGARIIGGRDRPEGAGRTQPDRGTMTRDLPTLHDYDDEGRIIRDGGTGGSGANIPNWQTTGDPRSSRYI